MTRKVQVLCFEKQIKKLAHVDGAQGPLSWAQMPKHTLILTSPTIISNPKHHKFFNRNYRTTHFFRGFDKLFSSNDGQAMTGQSHWHYSGFAVLKGFWPYQTQPWFVNIVNLFKPTEKYICSSLQCYNSLAALARELFKPSTDSASLLVSIKNHSVDLGVGFSWGERHKVFFLDFLTSLTARGRKYNEPFFRAFELLIDFLACLEPELWPKNPIVPQNQKIAEEAWVSHWRLEWIAITRRENMIESYSNPRKIREVL